MLLLFELAQDTLDHPVRHTGVVVIGQHGFSGKLPDSAITFHTGTTVAAPGEMLLDYLSVIRRDFSIQQFIYAVDDFPAEV